MSESPNRDVASLSLEAALYDSGAGRFSVRTTKNDNINSTDSTPPAPGSKECEQTER